MIKQNSFYASILLCFFICLSLGLFPFHKATAQHGDKSKIYTTNGHIIYGRIIQDNTTSIIRIENECGLFSFKHEEIDSIATVRPREIKSNGYFNLSSIGLLMGEGVDGFAPYPTLTTLVGYMWHEQYMSGLGLGYEYYDWAIMPVYGQFIYRTRSRAKVSPLFSARIGYGVPLKSSDSDKSITNIRGGVLLNPEIGIEIAAGEKAKFITTIGYAYQELSHHEPLYHWSSSDPAHKKVYTHINRISLRIGFRFY
jgi:hypothetical protein